jgi:hypothetical protein
MEYRVPSTRFTQTLVRADKPSFDFQHKFEVYNARSLAIMAMLHERSSELATCHP